MDWSDVHTDVPKAASLSTAKSQARVWDARTGALESTLEGHDGEVNACAWRPSGGLLATASWDRTVRLWDTTAEAEEDTSGTRQSARPTATGAVVVVFDRHSDMVWDVAWADGRVASASADRTCKVFDARTGRLALDLTGHASGVTGCAFAPSTPPRTGRPPHDGPAPPPPPRSNIVTSCHDRAVRIWCGATGRLERSIPGAHDHMLTSCAWSPDGRLLATASEDRTAKIWDAETGALRHTLRGHRYHVRRCAFAPDGKRLATAGGDSTVRLWDLVTGAPIGVLRGHAGHTLWCEFY